MSSKIAVLTLPIKAAVAVGAELFVTATGALPAAGGNAIGATCSSAAAGDLVSVDVLGLTIVKAGAPITAGALVEVLTSGKVVTKTTGVAVARTLDAALADGDRIRVLLLPN